MSEADNNNAKKEAFIRKVRARQVVLPILIGLGIVVIMLYYQLKDNEIPFDVINFTTKTFLFLLLAFGFMMLRDFGYIVRLRLLTENELSWRQAFRVIMLWEFTSSISPSAVGGTSVAVIFVHKEGISIGRSSAIVMATSFLDELYFIIMFPLIVFSVNSELLFNVSGGTGFSIANKFFYFAIIGYSLKLVFILVLAYGLFRNPHVIQKIILSIFSLKFLRRWRKSARRAGLDIVKNSDELKSKPFKHWLKVFFATFVSWTSRYWVVNALFVAFLVIDKSHFLLFARQLVMWLMMLISPTPGGSGFSEFIFSEYLGDFLPEVAGISIIMAFIWRLLTYYPYLIAGVFVVPKWIKEKF